MLDDISLANCHVNLVCSDPTSRKLFVHMCQMLGQHQVNTYNSLAEGVRDNTLRNNSSENIIYIVDAIPEVDPTSEIRFFKTQLQGASVIITYDDMENKHYDPFECLNALNDVGKKMCNDSSEPLEVYIMNSEKKMAEHEDRVREIITPKIQKKTTFCNKEDCFKFLEKVQFEMPNVHFSSIAKPLTMRSFINGINKVLKQEVTDPLVLRMRAYEKAVNEEISKTISKF